MTNFQEIFVDNMINLRKFYGMSQEKLALECNLDASSIGRIERKITSPTIKTCCKIAKALNQELPFMFIRKDLLDINDCAVIYKENNILYLKKINSNNKELVKLVKSNNIAN